MLGKLPMGPQWAAEFFATVLPPSAFPNVNVAHRDMVAALLVRATMERGAVLKSLFGRVQVAFGVLVSAFDRDPVQTASVVYTTFERLGELQHREFSLEHETELAAKDDLEARFGTVLGLFEFTHEQYYRTLAARYVVADALTRTNESPMALIDADGRVDADRMVQLEEVRGVKGGTLTEGLDRHLRNSAAHHRYTILNDDRIRLWDMNPNGTITWGPVEWRYWDLLQAVHRLSNTSSVLLLGLGAFDITYGNTIRARGWGPQEARPRPLRRDIVRSELILMAAEHGFYVEAVTIGKDGALVIDLRVKGETVIEQTTQIIAGGVEVVHGRYQKVHLRTVWRQLRNQVYGFLQTTFDIHGGYDLVTVRVQDGKTSLGTVHAELLERQAMLDGKEPVEAIRARLPTETLADRTIPIILREYV